MIFLLSILFLVSSGAHAKDICDILDLKNCPGVSKQGRRSSSQSLPSTSAAGNINPANVSQDKGLGAEIIYQPNNPLNASLVTGTGRVGGAFLSTSLENSFFGNRVVELDSDREDREALDKQYKSKKLTLGFSVGLFKNKNFGLDLGVILKQHPEVKVLNTGGGISTRVGPFTLGASYYADDLVLKFSNITDPNTGIPYSTLYSKPIYHERFFVKTFSAGVRIMNLFLDYGIITTRYRFLDDSTTVRLLSGSFIYKNFLLSFANRTELSPYWTVQSNSYLDKKTQRIENYGGIQYSFNQYLMMGLHYNYFLLSEMSYSATIFF